MSLAVITDPGRRAFDRSCGEPGFRWRPLVACEPGRDEVDKDDGIGVNTKEVVTNSLEEPHVARDVLFLIHQGRWA